MQSVKLIMVNGDRNNNKFYNMTDNGNGTFTAEYGRVGKSKQTKVYSIYDWDKKYYEKLNKGYSDVTRFQTVEEATVQNDIEDSEVRDLINKLTSFSSDFIKKNYTVASGSVTTSMVNHVQDIISQMKTEKSVWRFNRLMEEILTTIPRQCSDVSDLLANSEKDFSDILEREQSVLNVLASKVKANEIMVGGKDMLKAHGLTIKPVTKKEEKEILSHLDPNTKGHFKRAFKVVNKMTSDRFKTFCKDNSYGKEDVKFLYHGSRNQNWLGIIQQGLTLNNKAPKTGKMFGDGLYFGASYKSYNYLSLRGAYWNNEVSNVGYMAVYKVAMKNPHNVEFGDSSLNKAKMKKLGCDGTWAHKGPRLRADEWIVYDESQADIQYLLEIAL